MKKMLIAAISAIAVIASVVGCQVYDSQTNANLYHSGDKLQDFAAEFNTACQTFKDNSSDEAAYTKIVDAYWSFTEHFVRKTAMVAVKSEAKNSKAAELEQAAKDAGIGCWNIEGRIKLKNPTRDQAAYDKIAQPIIEKYNGYVLDDEWCKSIYKKKTLTSANLYKFVCDYVGGFYVKDNDKSDEENAALKVDYIKKYKGEYVDCEITANGDGVTWSYAALWEKTYKLRWDYNSKK